MDNSKGSQGVLFGFMVPSEEEIARLRDAIRARVVAHVGPDCQVVYDAFPFDDAGRPLDNLDEIAVNGPCEFEQKRDPEWGEGSDYRSGVVRAPHGSRSPRWLTP